MCESLNGQRSQVIECLPSTWQGQRAARNQPPKHLADLGIKQVGRGKRPLVSDQTRNGSRVRFDSQEKIDRR